MDGKSVCSTAVSLYSNSNKTTTSPIINKRVDIDQYEISPIDFEINIQTERIVSIFNEIITKTEVAIALLLIDKNEMFNLLETALASDELTFVKINLAKYGKPKQTPNEFAFIYSPVTKEEIQQIITQPVSKLHFELSQIIYIVMKHPEVLSKIPNYIKNEDSSAHFLILYLDSLCRLQNRMIETLTITAGEKLKKKILLRNLSKINKDLKLKISDVSNKLKQEQNDFDSKFQVKDEAMKKLQAEIDSLKSDCEAIIKKNILDSERQMLSATQLHNSKYEILKSNDNETKINYENLLNDNLVNEKSLRAVRLKVETQLLNWVHKYDQEIGAKQEELDDLTKNYEDEKLQLEDLQGRFEAQEIIYIPLMAEKEAEYQQEILNKMTTFLMEHAARIIQRAWRQILATRAEKRRQKRSTSKKKKVKDSADK